MRRYFLYWGHTGILRFAFLVRRLVESDGGIPRENTGPGNLRQSGGKRSEEVDGFLGVEVCQSPVQQEKTHAGSGRNRNEFQGKAVD